MLPGLAGIVGFSGEPGPAPFTPASLFSGTAGGFWDISDINTLWKDTAGTTPVTADGDQVARVDDKSGNGNHLLQATSAFRPLYKVSGGLKYLLFDGSNDRLLAIFALTSTWDRISAIQFLTFAAYNECYYGANAGSEQLFGNASGQVTMWNGSASGPTATGLSTGTDYVLTEKWRNPCEIAVDNGSYVTTPSVASTNPGGLSVATDNGGANPANFRFYGGHVLDRAHTAPEIASSRTYYGALQGRVL